MVTFNIILIWKWKGLLFLELIKSGPFLLLLIIVSLILLGIAIFNNYKDIYSTNERRCFICCPITKKSKEVNNPSEKRYFKIFVHIDSQHNSIQYWLSVIVFYINICLIICLIKRLSISWFRCFLRFMFCFKNRFLWKQSNCKNYG